MNVGEVLSTMQGRQEGCWFERDAAGYLMILGFNRPTQQEIGDVSAGSRMEIRECIIDGAMWITVKLGSMPWMDMPYNPHLSPDKPDGFANALTILLVDVPSGVVKHIRLVGLSERFAVKMQQDIDQLMEMPYDVRVYDAAISRTMARMDSREIAERSRNYCKM